MKPTALFDQSIRAKLIITLTSGTLAIIGILTFVMAQNATNLWEEEAQRQLSQRVTQSTETLRTFLTTRQSNLETWASKLLANMSEQYPGINMLLYFSDVKNKEPWIDNIYLIKPNNLIYDSFGTLELDNPTDSMPSGLFELLKEEVPDFTTVKLITPPEQPDEDVVLIKRPLKKQGVPVEGHYLALMLNLTKINQHLFAEQRIGKHGALVLAAQNRTGHLFWPRLPTVPTNDNGLTLGQPLWETANDIPSEFSSNLLYNQTLADLPFLIVGSVSLQDVREPVLNIIQTSIILAVIFSLIGVGCAIFMAEKISAPIRRLTGHIQEVATLAATGQLADLSLVQTEVPTARNDEIGILANAFHQLQEELIRRSTQISEHIQTLNGMNEELKKTNRLKDEFLANVSHELRTPLHGIIGITESMVSQPEANWPTDYFSNFSIIISSARRLHNLVNDILDSSMLKHHRLELHKKAIDMKQVTHTVLGLFHYLLGQKKIKLINAVPTDLPPVEADENRVQQIMHNLVENAIKFTQSGFVKISAQQQKNSLEIRVEDSGIGIANEHFEDIFEFFIQADGTISRRFGGTGLGLAITKQLLELHGGKIHVESMVGEGTTFIFTLPLSQKPVLPSPTISQVTHYISDNPVSPQFPPVPGMSDKKQFRLLLVDDDPINLQVLQRYLHSPNYLLEVATNGQEVFDSIERFGLPHLILLDVMMPGMSGFEVCRTIRDQFPAHELPIIFLTAKNQVADLVEGFALGGNDYISKPFSKEELLARVENQILLLQAKDQLISLRNFTHQIASYKNTTQIFEKAFQELCDHIYTDQALLFQEDKCLVAQNRSSSELLAITPHRFFAEIPPNGQEVYVFNTLNTDQISNLISDEVSYKNHHLILIRVNGLEAYSICLVREKHRRIFNSANIEYIRNIVQEITAMRKNIQAFVADDKFLPSINQIKLLLKKVLFIQAQAPYCLIVLDTPDLEEIEFRLTLQNLVTYFGAQVLFQVHRSYLVNPNKLDVVRRKPNSTYEVVLKDSHNRETPIPVGRLYIDKARMLCQQKK